MTYAEFASRFTTALADGDYGAAYKMLSPEMQEKYTEDDLSKSFEEMVEYGDSRAKVDGFVETLEDWPDKNSGDIGWGWVYVSVSGDDYAEAVTVIVSAVEDGMAISSIEWGRP